MNVPKVFVSHASEDKARFVIPFSIALRERGVDAWVDQWEILPGDSLVDKIFEEGLKESAAVLIVLSKTSVAKPWVREELNSAVVKRITKGTKLIPVVLDDCEVPEALRSLVWESVKDPANFETALSRVVDAVFGHSSKPPIGPSPNYLTVSSAAELSGLNASDVFVLQKLFDFFLESKSRFATTDFILEAAMGHGLDKAIVSESIEVLEHQGYAKQRKHIGPGPYPCEITTRGISLMLGEREASLLQQVSLAIVNQALVESDAIIETTSHSWKLVDHATKILENQGFIKVARMLGGGFRVHHVSPMLKRALSDQ